MSDDPFSREPATGATEFRTARPTLTGAQTFGDFRDESDEVRAIVYAGIGAALWADPANVPDELIELYSYGIDRDADAKAFADDVEQLAPLFSNFDSRNPFIDGTEFQELMLHVQGIDPLAADKMMDFDAIEREGLFLPALVVGVLVAAKGLLAVGGVSVVTGAQAGATAVVMKAGVLRIAAWATGGSATKIVARFTVIAGTAVTIGTGAPGSIASMFDNRLNPEENQDAEDTQNAIAMAQQDAALSTQQGGPGQPLPERPSMGPSGATAQSGGTQTQMAAMRAEAPGVTAPPPQVTQQDIDALDEDDLAALLMTPDMLMRAENIDNPILRVEPDAATGRITHTADVTPYAWGMPTGPIVRTGEFLEEHGYRLQDIQDTLANLSVGQVARLQDLGIRSGLINPDSTAFPNFALGVREFRTEAALATFMGQANFDGRVDFWASAMDLAAAGDLAKAKAEADEIAERPGYTRRPYMKLDPAFINEEIDRAAERSLGRKMNDWERTLLMAEYAGAHRQNYEAQEAAGASFFRAQYRAQDTHSDTGAGTFQAIDPAAQFSQRFRDVFENELDRRDRTEQVAGMTGNLMQGLRNAEAAVSR